MTKVQAGTDWENRKPVSSIPFENLVQDGHVTSSATEFSVAPAQILECTTVAIRGLSVPLEDGATYYFFHNFVSEEPTTWTACSHVLPTLYQQDSSFRALPKIIEAIGMAGISNMKQAPQLMVVAGQKYATVLRAITASIQDSKEASTDQTLIAVMLLGLFEVLHYLKMIFCSLL